MKCSLKDGFINILLLIIITPIKGIEFPLLLHRSSVVNKPMNLQQFRASINRLQDLDSFPVNGENQLHRIVKKQMASCDYKDQKKCKRSVAEQGLTVVKPGFRFWAGDGPDVRYKDDEKVENAVSDSAFLKTTDSTESGSLFKLIKDFAREKDLFLKRSKKNDPPNKGHITQPKCEILAKKEKEVEDMIRRLKDKLTGVAGPKDKEEKQAKGGKEELEENSCLTTECTRIPDKHDYRCYYECESNPNGCLKLKHRRCPQGQFFSFKYLKCLKVPYSKYRWKKGTECITKKIDFPESDDLEPSNEWLDATGTNQRIPSEFKPKKKPVLRIYHLRAKRKLNERLRGDLGEDAQLWGGFGSSHAKTSEKVTQDEVKKHGTGHHLPRSFVIRIKKKKESRDQITDNDENENDNDEDDEESDEEEEDDETDDEDDESEEEDGKEVVEEKPAMRETFRELLKSAKAAVTNKARFEEPADFSGRATSSSKSKKSDDPTSKDKKVLIDANIKVDSTISSILKNLLKSKNKDKEANNGFTDGYETLASLRSREQMGSGAVATYEHLIQNNPRVKRYFLANCSRRRN